MKEEIELLRKRIDDLERRVKYLEHSKRLNPPPIPIVSRKVDPWPPRELTPEFKAELERMKEEEARRFAAAKRHQRNPTIRKDL